VSLSSPSAPPRTEESAAPTIRQLLLEKRVLVCCGGGGVGKTTTAAALSLAAARLGRKVLVLTIDPSRRLAETLGVSRNPRDPVSLPQDRLELAGIKSPGSLHAWMLDPKLVADNAVRRLTRTEEEAERFLNNRIYQQLSTMVAGMHEYTAMEALHRLVTEGRYDLVVLDTPPSRNALDFLEAPRRLARLIDGRMIRAFLPKKGGLVTRAASKLLGGVIAGVFGDDFASEFTVFLSLFSGMFDALTTDVTQMRAFLGRQDAGFLLVSSPASSTLTEVHFFREKTTELGLPFRGFVLNRSRAWTEGKAFPSEELLPADASAEARSGLAKLQALARAEQEAAERDQSLLAELALKAGHGAVAVAVPNLPNGADDMGTLLTVADALARS